MVRETRTIPAGTTLSLADHCVTLEQETRVSASVEWWPVIQRSIECQHANHVHHEPAPGLGNRTFQCKCGTPVTIPAGWTRIKCPCCGEMTFRIARVDPLPRPCEMGEPT